MCEWILKTVQKLISKYRKAIKLYSLMKEKLKQMTLCDDNKNEIKNTPKQGKELDCATCAIYRKCRAILTTISSVRALQNKKKMSERTWIKQRRSEFWFIFHRNDRYSLWKVVSICSQRSLRSLKCCFHMIAERFVQQS